MQKKLLVLFLSIMPLSTVFAADRTLKPAVMTYRMEQEEKNIKNKLMALLGKKLGVIFIQNLIAKGYDTLRIKQKLLII